MLTINTNSSCHAYSLVTSDAEPTECCQKIHSSEKYSQTKRANTKLDFADGMGD